MEFGPNLLLEYYVGVEYVVAVYYEEFQQVVFVAADRHYLVAYAEGFLHGVESQAVVDHYVGFCRCRHSLAAQQGVDAGRQFAH